MRYESTGVAICSEDGAGHTTGSAPSADTNYALPGVLTPGGNANLATTVAYTSSWAVTSVTGPNGANGTTTYDNFGRPQKTKIPDGAETDYTYAYVGLNGAAANQQTAMLGTGTTARWKRTTLDGFGRVTRVENGNGPATNAAVSQVDTQYAPCACSPLGKVSQVSMPYAPGGTPVWTVYTYDGSGRTTWVTAPDGSVTHTEYLTAYGSYTGNLVRVTDAAGKWKIRQADALGNLVRVIEPNPAGGADWITNYTYDALGHLTGVSMPRSNGTGSYTQTRTFAYTGADLTSATNPENGTVTYQYDLSHRVTKRTDAMGQETRYTYDGYGRLTEVQHWAVSYDPHTLTTYMQEQETQRVDYYYDSNPLNGGYSQNAWGRLTAVAFQDENTGAPFSYMYSYNQAGRVTAQHMSYSDDAVHFDAAYGWDTEGRMTSINYGPQYQLTYDANGRLGGMSGSDLRMTASYGPAGEMLGLSYGGDYGADYYNETRTYNAMLQMTRMTVVGTSFSPTYTSQTAMDMQYVYTAGQNNGRIVQSIDGVAGETVNYTYDALSRLATAGATSGTWGQAFAYDGFGNLTGKTVTQGSAPTLSVSFDPMTNRQNGQSYDANGNPSGGWMSYDIENRMTKGAGGELYAYDPSGKRVKKIAGPEEFYFYGIGGQKLATMVCMGQEDGTGCQPPGYNVYFGGKLVRSKGGVVATDRLGSVRATSSGDRMTYYPYGEERTSTADGREKFGTYMRDNVSQDYADQRYYAVGTGRFGTPDPSNAGDLSNPHSLNLYNYVLGDPINFSDPEGLDCASTPFYYDGKYQGTVGSIIGADSDISTLATAMYTESGHGSKVDVFDEEYAIGAVIMNRWQFVNKNWYLSSSPGGASLSVSGWGTPSDSISSIVKNPSQFAIYTRNADGSVSLSASAQRNLDSALNSNWNSSGCEDLAWAIGEATKMWGSRNDGDPLWLYNGLILTGFNSFNPAHSSAPYEQKAGSFGDANTFYGVPDSYVSETKITPPRRRPPAPPRPRPRVPGEQQ